MKTYASAVLDFKQARERANLQEFFSRLTGKSTELLSYEEVRQKLKASGRAISERVVQVASEIDLLPKGP